MTLVHKIVFAGPVGSGKTTSIASISDIEPVVTEEMATDESAERKPLTTVAMDYGMIRLSQDTIIHLYGTPGQKRFNFMWDILTNGGVGLVLLLDHNRPDPIKDLEFFINAYTQFIAQTQVVVGITRTDLSPNANIKKYQDWCRKMKMNIPVFEVDGRKASDIALLVQTLLYCLDPGINSKQNSL